MWRTWWAPTNGARQQRGRVAEGRCAQETEQHRAGQVHRQRAERNGRTTTRLATARSTTNRVTARYP